MRTLNEQLQDLKARLQEEFPLGEPEVESNMFTLARDLYYRNPKKLEAIYLEMLELHLDGRNWIYAIFEPKEA